jgi:antirestriction protein ArdC
MKAIDNFLELLPSMEDMSWVQTWVSQGATNPATKTKYTGINRFLLSCYSAFRGQSHLWTTFKGMETLGLTLNKGAKGAMVVYYSPKKVKNSNSSEEPSESNVQGAFARGYYVFNLSDMTRADGSPAIATQGESFGSPESIPSIDNLYLDYVKEQGISMELGDPAYDWVKKKLYMPPVSAFVNPTEFIRAYYHELGHSTGVPLNRDMGSTKEGAYAKEELVAELISVGLQGLNGIQFDNNNIAYIQAWKRRLTDGASHLMSAASQAYKGVELITHQVELITSIDSKE